MLILPLKFIREEDKKTIGINLYHLAKLGHLGLPVIESVIAIPPADLFENAVNKYFKNHPNIKDLANHIKPEILKLKIPESLKNLEQVSNFPQSNSVINIEKLWENLLEKWAYELLSKIERGEKNIYHLTPQLVVFSANFTAFGNGFFDEDREHAVIKVDQGKLDFNTSSAIENLIIVGNKKLLLPQIYYWGIEDNKIKIVKVLPYTQSHQEQTPEKIVTLQKQESQKTVKTATKIYLDYSGEALTNFNSDGILLNIKKLDTDLINDQITKVSQFDSTAKFIFYPGMDLDYGKVLEFAKLFLFFRNKKKLDAQIVLPETFSKEEFLNLKREFASLGIYSKGSLKIWKQFNNVGDFLNAESYLDAGFDGAIINLDKIAKIVTGVDAETVLKHLQVDWIIAIEKFFKELGLSKIIKSNKQVLISGRLVQNEELLNYFIKSGVWGVALEGNESANLRNHIALLEKQALKKLTNTEIKH